MRVRVLTSAGEIAQWLGQRPDVEEVVANGHTVTFNLPSDPQTHALLLREMINAGFDIVEFAARTTSLEDVFLRVTRGEVQ